ncbi:MAG: hypothetical protein ACOC38_11135 [Promethearchaeia archaeon]
MPLQVRIYDKNLDVVSESAVGNAPSTGCWSSYSGVYYVRIQSKEYIGDYYDASSLGNGKIYVFIAVISLAFGSFTSMGATTAGQAGTTSSASTLGGATGFTLKVVAGCALEAVMELAFDVVNTKGAWALAGPLGDVLEANGKYLFFGLMIATTLASAALSDKLPVGAKLKNIGYLQKAGLSATVMRFTNVGHRAQPKLIGGTNRDTERGYGSRICSSTRAGQDRSRSPAFEVTTHMEQRASLRLDHPEATLVMYTKCLMIMPRTSFHLLRYNIFLTYSTVIV